MLPAKLHTMQLTTSPKPIDLNSMIAVTFHRHYRDSRLAHSRIPDPGESACSRKSLTSRSFVGCLERSRVDDFDGDSFAHQPPVVFESLLTFSRIQTEVRDRAETPSVAADGLVVEGSAGKVYNQKVFRHFLDIERIRAERSDRHFLLLLVSLRKCPDLGVRVPRPVASALFSGLALCVRDIDFIGWYRHERVVGAVLAQGLHAPDSEAPSRIVERVTQTCGGRLPEEVVKRLRVRVVQFGPRTE